MRKSLIVLLLFIFLGCSQSKVATILAQDYNFLTVDGGVHKLKQSNDTLYDISCYINEPCHESRYKIISTHEAGEFIILKLDYLGSIPQSQNLCPGKRYAMTAMKSINNEHLGYCDPLFACLTQYQLDTIQVNISLLESKPFLTFFSDSYLKELSTLKKISSQDDIKKIIDAIKDNDFNSGKISYSAEQLNKACIENGYNPVGAGPTIDLMWTSMMK